MQSQNRKRAPAWTEWEVLDLIAVWGEESVLSELRSKRRNAKTFQNISEAMRDRSYSRDATQCCVKLKEIRQAYQKTKESNGHSRTEPQTCRFYAELHAILGRANTTTPPLSVDSDDGVLSAMPEDFADGEDEEREDELEESAQHTVLPDSQDLFITLTEIPSQPNEAGEGTSGKKGWGKADKYRGAQDLDIDIPGGRFIIGDSLYPIKEDRLEVDKVQEGKNMITYGILMAIVSLAPSKPSYTHQDPICFTMTLNQVLDTEIFPADKDVADSSTDATLSHGGEITCS
ncbi:Zinc finger and SCAN domain-containing protein 29 [Chelonia mydas]|uniref:Zinc finger and SCAN domain-containing protein 29 n=1 Tax=Chelonia mydas TaxID=8469 RepID=M7BHR0_CHEMY|nr:Zinc finger and SCAN domain-containing protein 29 [Chelonia mydas]